MPGCDDGSTPGGFPHRDPVAARGELGALARALQAEHPGAASSLREGLEEILTVDRLGIDGPLLKTVFTTKTRSSRWLRSSGSSPRT